MFMAEGWLLLIVVGNMLFVLENDLKTEGNIEEWNELFEANVIE